MAKIALVCLRGGGAQQREALRERMNRFLESLRPDNLPEARVMVKEDGKGLFLGVFNPADEAATRDCSAYAGWLADPTDDWSREGAAAPDGTYALFRGHARSIELLADFSGSRTIWMAQTPELFIASTSQRAIPWFTGRFERNPRATLWMLSSGTLGPGESWDLRARALKPAGTARLDRDSWQLDVREPTIEFKADPVDDAEHAARFRRILTENFARLKFDWSQWAMPLSGGHDSRTLLLWMPDRAGLQTLTWGTPDAPRVRGSDAQIAQRVAQAVGVKHRYFPLENADVGVERVMERFLLAGEGRVDHLSGYMDGFHLWTTLAAAGVKGVVRGEHSMGYKAVSHADGARFRTGLMCWRDAKNLPALAQLGLEHLGLQDIPAPLQQKLDESADDWRDRLYQAFRIPTVFGALNDLKATYVEIANPLLLRPMVMLARSQPAHLRTEKKLFRQISEEKRVSIDYATANAIATPDNLLGKSELAELVLDGISSPRAHELLSPVFARYLTEGMRAAPRRGWRGPMRTIKSLLPESLLAKVKRGTEFHPLSAKRLALRAFLIGRMDERLRGDAQSPGNGCC